MGRRYTVRAVNQAIKVSGVSDLLAIMAGVKVLRVHRFFWLPYDSALLVAMGITTNFKVMTATITNGTGGAAITPKPVDPGDPAATFTVRANDITTQASTNGATNNHYPGWGHTYSGYGETPGEPLIIPPSGAGVFECLNPTLSGTPNLQYFAEIEELS